MDNLPAKQSAFIKIRNNILSVGLSNSFTRNIMVNTIPSLFGYGLTSFVLSRDGGDLTGTMQFLASMNPKAVKTNITYILENIGKGAFGKEYYYDDSKKDQLINMLLDAVKPDSVEIAIQGMLKDNEILKYTISDETCKRITDSIDCQSKSLDEIREWIDLIGSSFANSSKLTYNLFEKLTLEQRKEFFPQILILQKERYFSSDVFDYIQLFEQIPVEDRLEIYQKIIEIYNNEENKWRKSADSVSRCFEMLLKEEKLSVLSDTIKQIRSSSNDNDEKFASYIRVLGEIPKEEQEKYYKEALEYSEKRIYQITSYVSALDKSLHGEIVFDVLDKLSDKSIGSLNILELIKSFEPSTIYNAIVTTLNGDINLPETKFAVDLLKEKGVCEYIQENVQGSQIIKKEQLLDFQKKGYDVDKLTLLFVNLESNNLLQSYIENAEGKSYNDTLKELSSLGEDLKFSDYKSDNYDIVLSKKLDTYLQLFSILSPEERNEHFEETVSALLKEKKISYNASRIGDTAIELLGLLDRDIQISSFPTLVQKTANVFGPNYSEINEYVKKMDPEIMDAIYEQYINAFNMGGKENCLKMKPSLLSDRFVDGLIEKISKSNDVLFFSEEELDNILSGQYNENDYDDWHSSQRKAIVRIFVESRLGKIKNEYNNLSENDKKENVDRILIELSKPFDVLSKNDSYGSSLVSIASRLQTDAINEMYLLLDEEEKTKHFEALFKAFDNIQDDFTKITSFMALFKHLDNKTQMELFKNCTYPSSENLKFAVEILKNSSVKYLNLIFKGEITLDEETISKLMTLEKNITLKTLLFDKNIDREKIVDLSSYNQLQTDAISIDSIIQNIYINSQEKSKNEFNQLLADTYNLFTYNNVPEFMKNFRMFQLGSFHDKKNDRIKSFKDKTDNERDLMILEDLFKISLDSNNASLRDFSNIIIEGKRLTTVLQSNPEEKLKTLSEEELALLYQYRDTLFDLHNLTKEIRNIDRHKLEKTDDVIKDFRTIIAIYSDNETHNPNSKNIVFNPNKILDELFEGFITTSIRPKAMLEYMDRIKATSDERHLDIERRLKVGMLHLGVGDFVKGIHNFDDYIPSMLRDGVKGGEFNQEYSHSDCTPLDADFGYVSKANLQKENATDYEIISTTISSGYGHNYIVLKQYADRLQDRSRESFDLGTFTGSPDYYSEINDEEQTCNDRYIRTGVPVTDIDYIISKDWNLKNGYEMAMAGIYIPVINQKGKVVFTSDEYNRIREEMRGLSHYNAGDIAVSPDAKDMEVLYAIYRSVSFKTAEEIDRELETVQGLVEGKPDSITIQKKKATTEFIRNFFRSQGFKVTDDLSQNLSTSSVELIDTGSTGRGTNVPGDGDFDFMLRHNLPSDLLEKLTEKVRELETKEFVTVGDGFRAKDVTLPTGEIVDIDITTAKKSLALNYSSDMCVRDRLNNIKENDPESYTYVQANIIMAKKILKAKGIYKKLGSNGASEHGGFGGIGVENWILQNGGSFKTAIDTFLDVADKAESYDEFKKLYPIFDFGFNHREGKIRHDCFSAFFANDPNRPDIGYAYVKETLTEIQKALELEKRRQDMETPLIRSISPEGYKEAAKTKSALRTKFSFSQIIGYVSKYKARKESLEINENQSSLEEV